MTTRVRPPFGAVLVHPVCAVAVAVLLVNDHILKWHYPGVVTGKLSDLAGMVVAPLVLVAAADALAPKAWLRHPRYAAARAWASAIAVAAGFIAVKTWPAATHGYEAAFRGIWGPGRVVLVPDATDLVALPMALLAVAIALRSETVGARSSPE